MNQPLHVVYSQKSETGRRPTNDDCIFADNENGLYVLCDGAKGRFGGRTAAELACQIISNYLLDFTRKIGEKISPKTEEVVEEVLFAAHNRIIAAQTSDPTLEGMTSTIAMVVHRGSHLLLTHLGDSRIYLFRDPEMKQLTRDHNLENYIKDNPQFRPKKKLSGKTLVRALGLQTSGLKPEHRCIQIQPNDVIFICSDGLTDSLPPLTLREILLCLELESLDDVAARFIRSALHHGSRDNISVILLQATDKSTAGPRTTIYELESMSPKATRSKIVLGWLTFLEGKKQGEIVPLKASTVIGADPDCKIVIAEDVVSNRHAEVFRTEHGFEIRDLGSTNGTFINNVKITEASLVDGDYIRVGHVELVFKSHCFSQHI